MTWILYSEIAVFKYGSIDAGGGRCWATLAQLHLLLPISLFFGPIVANKYLLGHFLIEKSKYKYKCILQTIFSFALMCRKIGCISKEYFMVQSEFEFKMFPFSHCIQLNQKQKTKNIAKNTLCFTLIWNEQCFFCVWITCLSIMFDFLHVLYMIYCKHLSTQFSRKCFLFVKRYTTSSQPLKMTQPNHIQNLHAKHDFRLQWTTVWTTWVQSICTCISLILPTMVPTNTWQMVHCQKMITINFTTYVLWTPRSFKSAEVSHSWKILYYYNGPTMTQIGKEQFIDIVTLILGKQQNQPNISNHLNISVRSSSMQSMQQLQGWTQLPYLPHWLNHFLSRHKLYINMQQTSKNCTTAEGIPICTPN